MTEGNPNNADAGGALFLSYAGADREVAAEVAKGLRAAGVDIWWDTDGIGWGDDWLDTLQDKLRVCGGYIVLVGRAGVRRWVKAELYLALRRHFDDDLPIYPLLLPGIAPESLPPFLAMVQVRSLPEDLSRTDYAALAVALRTAREAPETETAAATDADVCPYPGLEAYQENSARFFFGRQVEALDLLRRLGRGLDGIERRWLQIEGTSGIGKSSLVRAGLIPAVERGWLAAEDEAGACDWIIIVMRPGLHPIETLASELERALVREASHASLSQRIDDLRKGTDATALRYLLKVGVPKRVRVLLVLDQLEEIFTLTEHAATRLRFDALLANALGDLDAPLHLVTTIRSDFMLRFGELPCLQDLLNERAGRYFLQPISEVGLRDVVLSPARRAGLRFSEPSLPDRIVKHGLAAKAAALPLVANVLQLLWKESRQRQDNVLSADDYDTLGGVGGALARSADELLNSLGAAGKERARGLLLALVKPIRDGEPVKRTVKLETALAEAGGGPAARHVLDRLSGQRDPTAPAASPRLVVVPPANSTKKQGERPQSGAYTVDLAHETLLRLDHKARPYWKTLRDWIDQDRKRLEDRELRELLAEKWQEDGKPHFRSLASRHQLRNFRKAGVAEGLVKDYLGASRMRQWLLRLTGGVALSGVLALGDAWWLATQGQSFDQQRWRALARLRAYVGDYVEPAMIAIPPGRYMMGSPDPRGTSADPYALDNEFRQHEVAMTRPLLIGKYEVTYAEYDLFAVADGRELADEEGWGRGRQPVINVSWDDAVAYAGWLSEQTGKRYRLPSEAEWEYAARAGTTGRYWWCEEVEPNCDVKPGIANCDGCGSQWDNEQTAPVGSFDPNPFGLYDTVGNVWEWVQDCEHESYEGAPGDGSAWEEDGCGLRVIRGGSWYADPGNVRSANRYGFNPVGGNGDVGFRLAQDIE